MTDKYFHRPVAIVGVVIFTAGLLTGCLSMGSELRGTVDTAGAGETVEVTKSPEPTFEPKQVAPIEAEDPSESVVDDGLGVQWRIVTVQQATVGGAEFVLEMKNLNKDFAVPPEAISTPTLSLKSGGSVDLIQTDEQGLDLPLGALSKTYITYTFDTSPWSLSNAEFKIANAIFKGNLNI